MLVSDVFSYLDELAPFSYSMDFDNSGLLIGDPSQSVKKILVALDCTKSVVSKAREMGADTGSDLSEISSRLVANSLDCMIASYEDVENIYLKNGFIMNLNNFLSKKEKKALKPYFVTQKDEADKVIGISLKDCKKYRTLFTGRTPITKEPVLYVITNATDEGKNYVKQLIHYLYSDELKQTE